jgi:hypothetical protein
MSVGSQFGGTASKLVEFNWGFSGDDSEDVFLEPFNDFESFIVFFKLFNEH